MNQKNRFSSIWEHKLIFWQNGPRILTLIMFAGLGLLTFSCHPKVFFTDGARQKLEEAGDDISMLQFYNDKEILLHRKTTSRLIEPNEGVVINTEGNRVVYLRIRRRTKCRIDSIAGDRVYIRFEDGDRNNLCFYKNT